VRKSEFLPFAEEKVMLSGSILPYTIGGAFVGLILSGTDFVMTRALDVNTYTKYATMGVGLGMFFGAFVSPNFFWTGGLIGFALGSIYGAGHSFTFTRMTGDYGQNAVEYLDHVTKEEKRLHKLQEMRLMGYSGNQLVNKN
jgi:hypothetical protein